MTIVLTITYILIFECAFNVQKIYRITMTCPIKELGLLVILRQTIHNVLLVGLQRYLHRNKNNCDYSNQILLHAIELGK